MTTYCATTKEYMNFSTSHWKKKDPLSIYFDFYFSLLSSPQDTG